MFRRTRGFSVACCVVPLRPNFLDWNTKKVGYGSISAGDRVEEGNCDCVMMKPISAGEFAAVGSLLSNERLDVLFVRGAWCLHAASLL